MFCTCDVPPKPQPKTKSDPFAQPFGFGGRLLTCLFGLALILAIVRTTAPETRIPITDLTPAEATFLAERHAAGLAAGLSDVCAYNNGVRAILRDRGALPVPLRAQHAKRHAAE